MNRENKLISFAKKFIPHSWNICTSREDEINKPGTLNIDMFFERSSYYEDKHRLGEIHGPMTFYQGVGRCTLFLWPHDDDTFAIESTLIHELAHVAVNRLLAWKLKQHKNGLVNAKTDLDENPHGPTFQRVLEIMLSRMLRRVEENMAYEIASEIERDLEYYRYVSDE